ncbi:MAG: transposase [Balneolaceae bacterium]|nr:transposase [Balneolaceae bacterium]
MSSSTVQDSIHYFVGIDISKKRLDCWLRPAGEHLRCSNDRQGFQQISQWLSAFGCTLEDTVLCLEDTGIYGKRLLLAMAQQGWACAVEKTTVLDKVGPEHHRKDDCFDARLLAEYADRFSDQLTITSPAEPALDRIKQLYAERRRLVRQRRATQTKQTQSGQQPHRPEQLTQMWSQQLALFDRQIAVLENHIQQIIETHKELAGYYRLLVDIPGVGQVTAWLWLILFYGQQVLDPKKIASRFGFAPHCHRSGSSVRGASRSSGHGHAEMRAIMTLAARSASTHYQRFASYKQRKLEEGKPWPVVRNNLINKLITITCAIWNSREPYDPDHTSRFDRQKNAA